MSMWMVLEVVEEQSKMASEHNQLVEMGMMVWLDKMEQLDTSSELHRMVVELDNLELLDNCSRQLDIRIGRE